MAAFGYFKHMMSTGTCPQAPESSFCASASHAALSDIALLAVSVFLIAGLLLALVPVALLAVLVILSLVIRLARMIIGPSRQSRRSFPPS